MNKCEPNITKMKEWAPFAGENMPPPQELNDLIDTDNKGDDVEQVRMSVLDKFKFLKLLPFDCSFIVRSNNNISLMAGTIRISIQKFLKNKHCITSVTIISLRRSIVPRILFVYRFFKTTHFKWAIIVSVSRFQSRFHRGIAIISHSSCTSSHSRRYPTSVV